MLSCDDLIGHALMSCRSDRQIRNKVSDPAKVHHRNKTRGHPRSLSVRASTVHRHRYSGALTDFLIGISDGFLPCIVPVGHEATSLERNEARTNTQLVQNIEPRVEALCAELDTLDEVCGDATTHSESDIQLEIGPGNADGRCR